MEMPTLSQHRSALQSNTSTCTLLGHHGSALVWFLDLSGHREVLTKDKGVFWNVKGTQGIWERQAECPLAKCFGESPMGLPHPFLLRMKLHQSTA